MPKFFATCPYGFSDILEKELKSFDLNLKSIYQKDSGVGFEGSWSKAYEVNLKTKVASRVLLPVWQFNASGLDHVKPALKKINISKYIKKGGTFSLKVKITAKSTFKDQKYLMNEIRVGLLESFAEEGRADIKVDTENPDLEIYVGVYKTQFSFSLNLSGDPLSQRGYRESGHRAPIRENIAAGLLRFTNWDDSKPLVDFMCGTGTFLVEAAHLNKINKREKGFAFQNWSNFNAEEFKAIIKNIKPKNNKNIFGYDQSPAPIRDLKELISKNKLQESIQIKQVSLKDLNVDLPPGIVILNPPYGERLGTKEKSLETYKEIGNKLKEKFKGWDAYIISPDPEHTKLLGMKSEERFEFDNGGIKCYFLKYKIY